MRCHHTREPLSVGGSGAARPEKAANREDTLAGAGNRGRALRGENAEANCEVTPPRSGKAGLVHKAPEPFRRRLANREPAFRDARPLWRKWIEDFTTPDCRDRREAPDDEPVAAPRHQGSLEEQPRQIRLARRDGAHLSHPPQHLGRSEMHAKPAAGG